MADVHFVFVREDEAAAEALADMLDAAGFEIGVGADEASVGIVIWSAAALQSRAFIKAAEDLLNDDNAIIAGLVTPPSPGSIGYAPAFDLSAWRGDPDDALLDGFLSTVDRMTALAHAGDAAPAEPIITPPPKRQPRVIDLTPSVARDDSWEMPLPDAPRLPVIKAPRLDQASSAPVWSARAFGQRGGVALRALVLVALASGVVFSASLGRAREPAAVAALPATQFTSNVAPAAAVQEAFSQPNFVEEAGPYLSHAAPPQSWQGETRPPAATTPRVHARRHALAQPAAWQAPEAPKATDSATHGAVIPASATAHAPKDKAEEAHV